jgi:hypothetical protein
LLVDLRRLKRRLDFEAEAERYVSPDPVHSSAARAGGGLNTSAGTDAQTAAPTDATPQARTTSSAEYIVSEITRHKAGALVAFVLLLAVVAAAGYGIYRLASPRRRSLPRTSSGSRSRS